MSGKLISRLHKLDAALNKAMAFSAAPQPVHPITRKFTHPINDPKWIKARFIEELKKEGVLIKRPKAAQKVGVGGKFTR